MTFFQRMSGFIYAVLSLFNILATISLFAMPIVLMWGRPLVAFANEEQLRILVWACFTSLVVAKITDFVMYLPAGYFTGQNGMRSHFWMSPYLALAIMRAFFLPSWLGGQKQAFKPSGSLRSDLNERDPVLRAGMWTRLRVIVFNYMGWYHIIYVYFTLTGVTLATGRCAVDNYISADRFRCLLTHAFWPPVSWLLVVSSFWIPITYALDPPSCKTRDELLDRDPKTRVAHPKESSKKISYGKRSVWYEFENAGMTLFTAFIFVAAFVWL